LIRSPATLRVVAAYPESADVQTAELSASPTLAPEAGEVHEVPEILYAGELEIRLEEGLVLATDHHPRGALQQRVGRPPARG
jgi:hypothetical protein